MTTLELARLVAQAALRATQPRGPEPCGDDPAVAVLKVLRESGHWFCRIGSQDADGVIDDDVPDEIMPMQPELFEVKR